MTIFIFTLSALVIVVAAMSVGVIFANKPIKGSCGGMGALGIDTECDICGGSTAKCEEERSNVDKQPAKESLFYDAKNKNND